MVPNVNVYVGYTGPASGCTPSSGNCSTEETIPFNALGFQYNYGCGSHSFQWNFGDNTPIASGQSVTHRYTTGGTYNLTLRITSPVHTVTVEQVVKVGGTATSCPEMVPNLNVYITNTGATSGCTAPADQCRTNENIAFGLGVLGYNVDCATHTYEWDFGDGTPKSSQTGPTHSYAQGGDYTVKLKLARSGQEVTLQRVVKVQSDNTCPAMVPRQNVLLQFLGLTSHCTAAEGNCQEDENIAFAVNAVGYNFTCAAHTFVWTFGDGTTSTQQSPTHKYTRQGDKIVTVKVRNSKQEVTISETIRIPMVPTKKRSIRR